MNSQSHKVAKVRKPKMRELKSLKLLVNDCSKNSKSGFLIPDTKFYDNSLNGSQKT